MIASENKNFSGNMTPRTWLWIDVVSVNDLQVQSKVQDSYPCSYGLHLKCSPKDLCAKNLVTCLWTSWEGMEHSGDGALFNSTHCFLLDFSQCCYQVCLSVFFIFCCLCLFVIFLLCAPVLYMLQPLCISTSLLRGFPLLLLFVLFFILIMLFK